VNPLRQSTWPSPFGLPNEVGLSSVLNAGATLDEALQNGSVPGLCVLTSGPLPANPAELLGTPQMTDLIKQLAEHFDVVLLDTSSLLAVTDATVLAPAVDGVLLVVTCAQARGEAVLVARQQLEEAQVKWVGAVINRVEPDGSFCYHLR
jgi:non-specific protein-tyrosine kinase